ncbi:hypothetical protein IFM89_039161, partial [Coptis chinensis]
LPNEARKISRGQSVYYKEYKATVLERLPRVVISSLDAHLEEGLHSRVKEKWKFLFMTQ